MLQAQIGKALSNGIRHNEAKGLEILRVAESRIQARGVGDSEAIYKLAQAYAVLGDKASAMRMLKYSVDNGFFPYPYFTSDPLLDGVRSESQFAAILRNARQRYEAFQNAFFQPSSGSDAALDNDSYQGIALSDAVSRTRCRWL